MFDDFDLVESCEEYYDNFNELMQYELSAEDEAELTELFG